MKIQKQNQFGRFRISALLMVIGLALVTSMAFAVDVEVNTGEAVTLPAKDVAKLAIADPNVADVIVLSEDEISVIGKKAGITTLTVTHGTKAPTELHRVTVSNNSMASFVRSMAPKSDISVREVGDALVLQGQVQDELEMARLQQVAEGGKLKVVNLLEVKKPRQISIRTRVLEINTTAAKKFGFKWFGPSGEVQYALDYKSTFKELTHGMLQPKSSSGATPTGFGVSPSLDVILQLFMDNNIARLLSEPTLITRSGSEANFLVGEERPIVQTLPNSVTVDYKKIGVMMKIKPTVDSQGRILTVIRAEVSQVTGLTPNYDLPIIGTKNAETTLQVNDGQTIVIGGLLENNINRDYLRKVPWLGDIPLFGYLFRQKERDHTQREVLFFMTPTVLKDEDAATAAAAQSPAMRDWNGKKANEKVLEVPKVDKPDFQFLEHEDKETTKKAEPAAAAVAPKREPMTNFGPAPKEEKAPVEVKTPESKGTPKKAEAAPKAVAPKKAAPAPKAVAPKKTEPAPKAVVPKKPVAEPEVVAPVAPKREPTTNFGPASKEEKAPVEVTTPEPKAASKKAAPAPKKAKPAPKVVVPEPVAEPEVVTPVAPKREPTTNFGPARKADE